MAGFLRHANTLAVLVDPAIERVPVEAGSKSGHLFGARTRDDGHHHTFGQACNHVHPTPLPLPLRPTVTPSPPKKDTSVDSFFEGLVASNKLTRTSSIWALHSTSVSINWFKEVLERANQFLRAIFTALPMEQFSREVQRIFNRLDMDGNGVLDRMEIQVGFERMGLSMTLEEVDEWIIQYDSTKDGVIDSDEFEHMARLLINTACPHNCPVCPRGGCTNNCSHARGETCEPLPRYYGEFDEDDSPPASPVHTDDAEGGEGGGGHLSIEEGDESMEEEAEEEEAEMDQSLAGLGNRSMDGTCESVDGSSAKSGQDLDSDLEEEEEGSDLLTQHLVSPQAPSDGRLRAGQPTLLGSPIPKMEEARHFLDDDADDDEEEDGEEDDDGAGADASSWGSGGGGPPLSGTPGVSLCANCGNTSCCGKAGQAVARSSVAHMSTQTDEDYFSSRESSNGSVELTDSDLGANAPIERGEWGSNAWPLRSTLLDGIVDPGAALYHRRRLSAPESSRPVSREEMERVAGSSQRGSGAASGGAASRTHSGSSSSFSGRVDGFARERRSSTFSERRSSTFSERRSSTSTTDGLSRVASSSSMVERRLSVPHTIMLMADTLPLPRAAAASSASFHAHAQPRPVCVPRDAHPSRAMHAVDAAHKWADAHASHNYAGPSRPGSSEEQRRPLPPMPEPSSTEQLLQEVQRAAVHAIDVHVRERRKSLACTPWTVTPHPAPARTSSGAYAPPSRPASSSSSAEAAAQGPYRLRTRQRSLEDMGSSAAAAERAAEHRPAPPRASRSRSVSNIFLDATDGAAMIL